MSPAPFHRPRFHRPRLAGACFAGPSRDGNLSTFWHEIRHRAQHPAAPERMHAPRPAQPPRLPAARPSVPRPCLPHPACPCAVAGFAERRGDAPLDAPAPAPLSARRILAGSYSTIRCINRREMRNLLHSGGFYRSLYSLCCVERPPLSSRLDSRFFDDCARPPHPRGRHKRQGHAPDGLRYCQVVQ